MSPDGKGTFAEAGTTLAESVAAALGRKILSGEYEQGSTLPTEPSLQEEFGVSRTAVREAIRTLSAKGLTVSRPKIGTRVLPSDVWNMFDPDLLGWALHDPSEDFLQALFEVREIFEPACAERAAERATLEEIDALGVAMDGIATLPRGTTDHIQADLDFHNLILEATRNPMLMSLGAAIESAKSVVFSLGWRPAMREKVILHHRNVYDAIRKRQGREARVAMQGLLQNSKSNFLDMLKVRGGGNPDNPPPSVS